MEGKLFLHSQLLSPVRALLLGGDLGHLHGGRRHELGPHELDEVPVGELGHGVGEGQRARRAVALVAVPGQRHLLEH